jgi:hypothetical protein
MQGKFFAYKINGKGRSQNIVRFAILRGRGGENFSHTAIN